MTPPHHLLLIDDDPVGAELTMAAVKMVDARVEVDLVADGEEALDYLFRRGSHGDRQGLDPSAVLLDLKMPKVDGHEVLRQIREHPALGGLKVVVLTSSNQARDRERSRELGCNGYLVKPASIMELIEQLRHCEPLRLGGS